MGDGPHTYEVEAFDAAGQPVWQGWFDVVHTRWPYLRAFPAWGYVHPPTGCVRLWANGALLIDLPLATDPERVWNYVQDTYAAGPGGPYPAGMRRYAATGAPALLW